MIVEHFSTDDVITALAEHGPIARNTLTPREQAIFTLALRQGAIDLVKIAGRWHFARKENR